MQGDDGEDRQYAEGVDAADSIHELSRRLKMGMRPRIGMPVGLLDYREDERGREHG
jgi:hypothetical protein